MFGRTFKLFTIFGFTVKMDLSWLVMMLLVIYSLTVGVFPSLLPGLTWPAYLLMGLAGAAGLFLSIVVHELSHSLVARRFDMPMKGITLFLFGGVAEMSDEPPSAKAEFLMAGAGPLCSVVVGVGLWGLSGLGQVLGWPMVLTAVMGWIGVLNFVLAVFNMVPAFPLDGGRILRAIFWGWKKDITVATCWASRGGSGFGIILMVLGGFNLFMMNLAGLWWVLIGMFIRTAARQSYRQVLIRQALQGEPVERFMNDHPVTVPRGISVRELVENYVYRYHFQMFPVVDEQDELVGVVSTEQVKALDREQWEQTTVDQIARPPSDKTAVEEHEDAMKALNTMSHNDASRLLVVDHGHHLRGVLSLRDLLKFMALKTELEMDKKNRRMAG